MSFPSIIPSEPPPLDLTSDEDQDSEEFRTPGLKLDLLSAESSESSPFSTPRKTPKTRSPSAPSPLSKEVKTCQSSPLQNGHTDTDSISATSNEHDAGTTSNSCPIKLDTSYPSNANLTDTSLDEDSPQDEFKDCQQSGITTLVQELANNSTPSSPSKSVNLEDIKLNNEKGQTSDGSPEEQYSEDLDVDVDINCDLTNNIPSKENLENLSENGDHPIQTSQIEATNDLTFVAEPDSTSTNFHDGLSFSDQTVQAVDHHATDLNDLKANHNDEFKSLEDDFDEFQEFTSQTRAQQESQSSPSVPASITNEEQPNVTINQDFDGEDFGDFAAFDQPHLKQQNDEPELTSENKCDNMDMKTSHVGTLDRAEEPEDDYDDFGDFSSTSFVQAKLPEPESMSQTKSVFVKQESVQSEIEDDFANFHDFKEAAPEHASCSSTSGFPTTITSPRSSVDYSALESKFENLIKTLIPTEEESSLPNPSPEENLQIPDDSDFKLILLDKELTESSDSHWKHVLDFEESRALLHKWLNSSYQQKLYRSLNMDTSTIVYTEKWGVIEVPRFAASMVESPILQPQVCSSTLPKSSDSLVLSPKSGSFNSEDNSNSIPSSNNNTPLSKEAQQILQRIPDISFMTSKTLVFPQAASSTNSLL